MARKVYSTCEEKLCINKSY